VAVGGNGAFTANLSALNPGTITSTLTVGDTARNSFSATGHSLTIDPGPTAGTGVTTVGHNQTVDLTNFVNSLVTRGSAATARSSSTSARRAARRVSTPAW
jgi:hypothetical protein